MALPANKMAVNNDLYRLGLTYHESIPLHAIDVILTQRGFKSLDGGIYCGRSGRVVEEVGDGFWLTLNWYQMEVSKRYEIVAYLSKAPYKVR